MRILLPIFIVVASVSFCRGQMSISDGDTTYTGVRFALQHAEKVERLTVLDSEITYLTDDLLRLRKLKVLTIYSHRLHELPPVIYKLKNLEELSIIARGRSPFFVRNDSLRISAKIADLTKLRSLTLFSQGILDLPPELAVCDSLTTLMISYSPLDDRQFRVITSMKQLKVLGMQNCFLKTLPDAFSQLDLEELHLDHVRESERSYRNEFTAFPQAIFSMKNLRTLGLDDNRITHIPDEIRSLKKLQRLRMWNNRLSEIPEVIGELDELQQLDVSMIYAPDSAHALRISDAIGKLNKLTYFNIEKQGISRKRLEELRKLLPQCTVYLYEEYQPPAIYMQD